MSDDVDRLIDERPGKELLTPAYDEAAHPVTPFLYRSGGTTAAYMLATSEARVIVNTGLGYEAPHHKRLFDAVCAGPTPYIVTTQAHVDHVGGVALFREPDTRYVAQANNPRLSARRRPHRRLPVAHGGGLVRHHGPPGPGDGGGEPGGPHAPGRPRARRHLRGPPGLTVGDLDVELIATPGGETIDSAVVWLPHHGVCLVSNLFGPLFPHFPNLNTLRGDRYRLWSRISSRCRPCATSNRRCS